MPAMLTARAALEESGDQHREVGSRVRVGDYLYALAGRFR